MSLCSPNLPSLSKWTWTNLWAFWSIQPTSALDFYLGGKEWLWLDCSKLWEFAIHNVAENRGEGNTFYANYYFSSIVALSSTRCYFFKLPSMWLLVGQVGNLCVCVWGQAESEGRQCVFVCCLNISFPRKEADNLKEIVTFWKETQSRFNSCRPQRNQRKWRRKMVFLALQAAKISVLRLLILTQVLKKQVAICTALPLTQQTVPNLCIHTCIPSHTKA